MEPARTHRASLIIVYTNYSTQTAGKTAKKLYRQTDRHRNESAISTYCIVSKLFGKLVIFSLCEGLDGLLLHTHGEQGLNTQRKKKH